MAHRGPQRFLRFVKELRRRRVLRVAGAYLVAGWIAIEVTSVLVPELLLPGWVTRAVIVLVVAGFPIAVVLAWAFDLGPGGVERTVGDAAVESGSGPAAEAGEGRRAVWLALGAVVVLVAAGTLLLARSDGLSEDEARAALAEIAGLAEERSYVEAYRLAELVDEALPEDSSLAALWPRISDVLTVHTEPAGATVTARMAAGDSVGEPVRLGTTPLDSLRIPRAPHHLLIELAGHAPVERVASAAFDRSETYGRDREIDIELELIPESEAVEGAVYVPGGDYALVSPDMPGGLSARLDGYLIDRYEVSNARFREFVAGGGYRLAGLWPSPIVAGGDTLAFQEVARRFVDRTGLPAPRGWTSGTPPAGMDDHPVTGVSWYEAAAYCAFREMSLPSAFQWEKAARDGRISHIVGMVMPWGLIESGSSDIERANFAGSGTVPVDRHPFGISPYGAYGMAGNVKEWIANPLAGGRAATGGSWEDPLYLFPEFGSFDPAYASASLGFRCARVRAEDARRTRDQGTMALAVDRRVPSYDPVDSEGFRAILSHYRYDPAPLDPEVLAEVETPEWVRHKVSFNGPHGDRLLAYLWLPKSTSPPYQTLVVVPGSDAFRGTPVYVYGEHWLSGLLRSGRALFAVVMEGMTERPWPDDFRYPEPESVRFRELMVRHATELRFGLDYLESRGDVDLEALGYVGVSWGAGSRLGFAAVDDRFDAVVLVGGGIDERVKPTLPEADNVNFAPHIDAPTLLLNGRHDEEHPWEWRALPLWNLLTEPKELVLVEDAGHIPPANVLIPVLNRFLDEHLGPVGR